MWHLRGNQGPYWNHVSIEVYLDYLEVALFIEAHLNAYNFSLIAIDNIEFNKGICSGIIELGELNLKFILINFLFQKKN